MTRPLPAFVHSQEVKPRACPVCQRVLDGATGVSLNPADPQPLPTPGAVTCCAYCGTILVVTTLGFRPAADVDLTRLHPTLRRLLFEFSASVGKRTGH